MERVPIEASKARMGELFSLSQTPLCGRGVKFLKINAIILNFNPEISSILKGNLSSICIAINQKLQEVYPDY